MKNILPLTLLTTLFVTIQLTVAAVPVSNDWSAPVIVADTSGTFNLFTASDKNGNIGAVWAAHRTPDGTKFDLFFSKSQNSGKTWSEPRKLIEMDGKELNTWPGGIAAGDNGIWMIAARVQVLQQPPPFPSYNGVLISYDSGASWGNLVDLSGKFTYPGGDTRNAREQEIAYAGNTAWLYVLSTTESIYYIRSIDNGVTWGNPVYLEHALGEPVELISSRDGKSVVMNYLTYDASLPGRGPRVSVFSTDNGQTFGEPIVSSAVANDENGKWLLADWASKVIWLDNNTYDVDGDFILAYSSDAGHSFNFINSPPSIKAVYPNLRYFVIDSLSLNVSGDILLVGTVGIPADSEFTLPHGGLVTRSSDFGQTWTGWQQLPDGTRTPPITAAKSAFVSVDSGSVGGLDHNVVYSRRLELAAPTAAADWQLYQ
jgi:hypothetical protein